MEYFVVLAIWTLCGFGGKKIFENKGRDPIVGFLIGFFLGLIGLLICACLPSKKDQVAARMSQVTAQ